MQRVDISPIDAEALRAPLPVAAAALDDPWTPGPVVIGLGLLALSALASGLLVRRRRDGGATTLIAVDPDAPSTTDAIDVELHEMIAEARAQRMLSEVADTESDGEREPTASR